MRCFDVNFSSLNAEYLVSDAYRLSRKNYDAYLYFKAEFRPHVYDAEFERMVVVRERRFNFKKMLSDLKDRLERYDGFLSVSPNSDTYSFISAEYKSAFSKDLFDNYIVPKKAFSKVKTRK